MKTIPIPKPGKIDIHGFTEAYYVAMENFKKDETVIPENKALIISFLNDAEIGKTIKKGEKKKIGHGRCLKYIGTLKRISGWLGVPFDKATQTDMEEFIRKLESGRFKPDNKESYTPETIVGYKKIIKKFYKWLNGGYQYPKIVEWIDTFVKLKETPALNREQLDKLISLSRDMNIKAALMFLFDSGARIEEFMNVRLKHLTRVDNYYMVRIEFSKTKPRTISLPLSTEILDKWLAEHPFRNEPESPLFMIRSDVAMRSQLRRLGVKALGRPINPHLFRHSSATYYCNSLSRYQLCYRYGWAMSSDMPDRYIDREGIHEKETAKIIQSSEWGIIKDKNQHLTEEMRLLKSQHDSMESQLRELAERDKLATALLDVLAKDKAIFTRLTNLVQGAGLKVKRE